MSIVTAETAELPLKLTAKTLRRFILGALRYSGQTGLIEILIGANGASAQAKAACPLFVYGVVSV